MIENQLTISALFDLEHSSAGDYLRQFTHPWEALSGISDFVLAYGSTLPKGLYKDPEETGIPNVWIARSAKVAPTAFIQGPCVIEPDAEIRHCAYIRGSALIGKGAVVGNLCEMGNLSQLEFSHISIPPPCPAADCSGGDRQHGGGILI